MADFVYQNVSLPANKTNKVALGAGDDPLKSIIDADVNALLDALKSARSGILQLSPGLTPPGSPFAQPTDVPAGTAKLFGKAAATGGIAFAIDNATLQTTGTILSLRTGSVERLAFDFGGTILQTQANSSVSVKGNRSAADTGADVVLGGQALRTAGRITSFQNNAVEKSFVNKDGVYVGPDAFGRVTVADTNYTSLVTDNLVSYTSITAARTVTLTHPQDVGHVVVVKDESGSVTGVITITITDSGGAGNMEGGTNKVINTAFGVLRFYWSGAKWFLW